MKGRVALTAAALAGAVLVAAPAHRDAAPIIDDPLRNALSGIDFVTAREVFDDLLGTEADADLVAIAEDEGGDVDPGLRIRAYRALGHYPTELSESSLRAAVAEHADPGKALGVETVYARAAMESLARVAGGDAVPDLAPVLDHPTRDLRAAAARALAATGSADALPPLRARLASETEPLVVLALQRALSSLEGG